MNFKIIDLSLMAAAVVLAVGSLPAVAAMPVAGFADADGNSGYVFVAKKKRKPTRQQEVDKSVESGTVPSRYRSSVPKQYHQYIPFAK